MCLKSEHQYVGIKISTFYKIKYAEKAGHLLIHGDLAFEKKNTWILTYWKMNLQVFISNFKSWSFILYFKLEQLCRITKRK